jgi:hypothetical protein
MKKLIFGIYLAIFSTQLSAQEPVKKEKSPEEIATRRVEHLRTALELNSVQVETIKAALVTKLAKIKVLHEQHKGDKEAMKKAVEPVENEFIEVMKKTLTETQYTQWKELRQDKHPRSGKHRNHPAKAKKSNDVEPKSPTESK